MPHEECKMIADFRGLGSERPSGLKAQRCSASQEHRLLDHELRCTRSSLIQTSHPSSPTSLRSQEQVLRAQDLSKEFEVGISQSH